ncbi:UV DNA damage repair endonuclease UvsE [Heliorestis acidaminivorans]|uniref:UV DNA damage repair endonuclease UvsE n=1 Tax=Heliorestis acidaminivorans TaxID=553427 RepID=UPI001478E49F|nr:UV DNA damage repair endonuclease UvsE [Heliorestis acidaminivorans]
MIRLGYACLNTQLPALKTCRWATYQSKGIAYLRELALHNLSTTLTMIRWNIERDILVFRMSSDLIPFASKRELTWSWYEEERLLQLTEAIRKEVLDSGMRLSMHPGQYTILNSPRSTVVEDAIADLSYHATLLKLCGGTDMIIHLGGVYGDKKASMDRFVERAKKLSPEILSYLRIENDDKVYTAEDVLLISKRTGIPVVVDLHHEHCNPSSVALEKLLPDLLATWGTKRPKIHISSGRDHNRDRKHADFITLEDWQEVLTLFANVDVDVMIEAKEKEQALLRLRSQ